MKVPDVLARECRTNYPAYFHGGPRSHQALRYIVLHSTETAAGSAEAVARYFMQPSASGSANLVVDDTRCYRTLADLVTPYAAPPLNTHGFHIEQCGYASWSRARWLLHCGTIRRAAYKAALRCKWYKIPVRLLLAPAALQADFGAMIEGGVPGVPGPMRGGITTHAVVSQTYHQSTHTDPGDGYPIDLFLHYLDAFMRKAL